MHSNNSALNCGTSMTKILKINMLIKKNTAFAKYTSEATCLNLYSLFFAVIISLVAVISKPKFINKIK